MDIIGAIAIYIAVGMSAVFALNFLTVIFTRKAKVDTSDDVVMLYVDAVKTKDDKEMFLLYNTMENTFLFQASSSMEITTKLSELFKNKHIFLNLENGEVIQITT